LYYAAFFLLYSHQHGYIPNLGFHFFRNIFLQNWRKERGVDTTFMRGRNWLWTRYASTTISC